MPSEEQNVKFGVENWRVNF